jgi:hypothetical protein
MRGNRKREKRKRGNDKEKLIRKEPMAKIRSEHQTPRSAQTKDEELWKNLRE